MFQVSQVSYTWLRIKYKKIFEKKVNKFTENTGQRVKLKFEFWKKIFSELYTV
jgi:hypothetical protein